MNKLESIYKKLYKAFGPQHWWPGDTPFEVAVGAILTQNTNWGNVEKAINNLKKNSALTPSAIFDMKPETLAQLIRPAGYYNIKAMRLKSFVSAFMKDHGGSVARLKKVPLDAAREWLLSVKGIGPETADSILLYALDKPIFVVDAYTKRVLHRHGIVSEDAQYQEIQDIFMDNLKADLKLFNEYHALIVRVCKEHCKKKPDCPKCPLNLWNR